MRLTLIMLNMLALAKDDRVLATPEPVLVVSYGDSAITVRLRLHARYDDFSPLLGSDAPAETGMMQPISKSLPQREYKLLS